MDAKNLTSIEIPETLEIIGGNAFEGSGLREVLLDELHALNFEGFPI